MGRKHTTVAQPAAQAPQGDPREAEVGEDADLRCGICGQTLDPELEAEGYLQVRCNTCPGGGCSVHRECGVEFVLARASEKSNSHAAEKYKIKARKRPQEIFSLGMPCPNGAFMIGKDEGHGRQTVGSQGYKGAKAATGACPGFTTAAELVKPAKAPPAPPPPEAAPAPRGPKKAKPSAPAGGQAKRGGTPASSASSSSTHLPARAPSGAGIRLVGEKHAGWSTVGQPKGAGAAARIFGSKGPPAGGGGGGVPGTARSTNGGGGSGLSFPTGMRPLALQLCPDFEECGECFHYQCRKAHGEAELRERERQWAAQQEAQKREAAWRKAQAAAAAQAKLEEEQALQAQIASLETHKREMLGLPNSPVPQAWVPPAPAHAAPRAAAEPALRLSDASLSLMRSFKKQLCLNTILDLGFSAQQAQAATDAAAADPERAAQLLLDGQPCTGVPPIDLSREVQALGGVAAALGVDAGTVEAQLLVCGGNVDAALEALQSGCGAALPSASASTVGDPSTAEPDTPSARLPPWAADAASSAFSAPSPAAQSPRAAAALAPGAALFGGAAAAEPGVLSLADFSSSPGPDAALAVLATNGGGWAAQAEAEAGYAAPTSAAAAFGMPLPAPLPLATQPGPAGFDAGYAAGMAAAAMLHQQPGAPAFEQPGAPPAQPYVPPPQARPEGDDEEVDALLALLGIG